MAINKNSRLLFGLGSLWAILILALGWWWLYLILNLQERVSILSNESSYPRFLKMMKWEGGTFFVSILLLSATLLILYYRDLKKTNGMQAFMSSLTHELKTPLASIRLQADVIDDLISKGTDPSKVKELSQRLIEDTQNLETQMDKVLQLSRIEQGGDISVTNVNLSQFIPRVVKKWGEGIDVSIESLENVNEILADEFALELIFRNLLENTKIHSKNNQAKIEVKNDHEEVSIQYGDEGSFTGQTNLLTTLFYKHDSKKGSGIGLYLSRRLTEKMKGKFVVETTNGFSVKINLLSAGEKHVS